MSFPLSSESYHKSTALKDILGDLIDFFKYLEDLFDLEIEPINKVFFEFFAFFLKKSQI